MTLRKKTLIIIGITLMGLIALLYFISQTILLSSYTQLEEQGVRQNVERVQAALLDELATLENLAGDWAPWDDAYAFVQDRNEQFIKSNLPDSALTTISLNFMLFINTSGQLVFGKAVDLQSGSAIKVPQSLQDYLAGNQLILDHTNPEASITGLIPLPEGPLLFASRPIVTSNFEGPIRGTLVVGRYLDAAEIESLAEATRLSISIRPFDDPQLPLDYQTAQAALSDTSPIFVQPLDEDRIAGYTLIEDVSGQPILIVKVDMPREVYQRGQASLSYFMLWFLMGGLLFGLVIMLLLEKEVLSRLTHLSQSVSSIGASGNSSKRVSVTGSDELASLGRNINQMLAALGQSEEALRKAHQQLEARVEERTAELSKSNELLKQGIRERQRAEEALRRSEQRFRQLVSSISDHIYVTELASDGNHHNLYLSHHVEALTGYPWGKFVDDWSFWPTKVIHPEDQAEAALQAARLAGGENSQLEYRLIRANGDIIWVRDSARVEKDPTRQIVFVYGVVSDITERKRAEAELAEAHEAAVEANRLKGQLLANVSHDLRTPLSTILGYVDMLQVGVYGPLSDKQRGITQKIMNSTAHLTSMVNKLLDQAHLEAGTLKLTTTSFSPSSLIEHVHGTLDVLAESKGIKLTSNIVADTPPNLSGDFTRVQQIVTNLVENAIKFTEQGSVNLSISRFDDTYWAIQITDTGPGIPTEAQTYIFDAFRQVDGTATRQHGGFGLGLSIVKQLTTLMGGQVKVESTLGQGSAFTILLPLTYEREVVA